MANIKVDPDNLCKTSKRLKELSRAMAHLANDASSAGNSAPSYEGQFGSRVSPLGLGAISRLNRQAAELENYASQLERKAAAFEQADNSYSGSHSWLDLLRILREGGLKGVFDALNKQRLLEMTGLLGLGSLFLPPMPWNPNGFNLRLFIIVILWKKNLQSLMSKSRDDESPPPPSPSQPWIENIIEEQLTPSLVIGNAVKKGDRDAIELGYPRNGYNGVQSNCTWFAAQAVLLASNGKVEVKNWRGAEFWKQNANLEMSKGENGFVTGIDKEPTPGDIICFDWGHVAYVEDVQVIDGKTYVTWVEEGADGIDHWTNSEQIIIDGEPVLRWRIKRPLNELSNKADFIHLRYD